ncbi:poly-beta-1,6 N-acetyl-D-glucosamine export porin PgaA [Guyparkeria halopsychrophila]|uniref:poly-beta-1,6 N-acetyl-D-glucosamine export porin PgaA n=1 Tax=Guyparkeria halopsychrophila TaxID=3139421 RepID=UPI0037C749F5
MGTDKTHIVRSRSGTGLLLLPFLLATPAGQLMAADSADASRVAAVELAREGQLDRAIARLESLDAAHPGDRRILGDLIVLHRQAGDNAAILERTAGLTPSEVPEYAHIAWAGALRDARHFEQAAAVLKNSHRRLGTPASVRYGVVSAEAGDTATAIDVLQGIDPLPESASEIAMMAYGMRLSAHVREALALANYARRADPEAPSPYVEQTLALWQLGAAERALEAVRTHPERFEPDVRLQIEADAIAADIRQAIDQRDQLLVDSRPKEANAVMSAPLRRLDGFIARVPTDHPQHRRALYDRIFLLRESEWMPETIATWETLPADPIPPPFARRAAADAYLAEKQPEAALPLYESLLPASGPADLTLLLDLYYTLIALEDYDRTAKVRDRAAAAPAWLPTAPGRDPVPNWERVDVDQLLVNDAAYRQQDAEAWRRSGELVDAAPAHSGLWSQRAQIARWRGWPERAEMFTAQAEAWAPEALETRLSHAADARDLGHWEAWEAEVDALAQDFPHDSRVQRQLDELDDRDRFSIESEVTVGRTRGGEALVSGSDDQSWRTRLNSPWSAHDVRAFVEHRRETATYDETEGTHDRVAAGVEWAADRKRAWAAVHRNRLGSAEAGVAAGWSQWLNDHWQIGIEGDSYSLETPLRAKEAGLEGWSASASVNWRASESLAAYATTGLLAIDDGNRRLSLGTGVTRRVSAGPHHVTDLGGDLFYQDNSQPGGPYYNPESSGSAAIRVDHDWITWRRYDRAFTQRFHAATGMGYQADFGSNPVIELRYEHRWDLNRRWAMRYGIGWSSVAYDGERERRLYGLFGLEGIF